jgi:hypothetical protein
MDDTNPPAPEQEVASTDHDIDRLKACIRQAVARRHLRQGADPSDCTRAPTRATEWLALVASLQQVEQHLDIGHSVPDLARVPGPLRKLARFLVRAMLLPAGFLIRRQTECNQALLRALHDLSGTVHVIIGDLERDLRRVEGELQRQRSPAAAAAQPDGGPLAAAG